MCHTSMTEYFDSIPRTLIVAAMATLLVAGPASAQRKSAPSGWVGLSVVQSGHGDTGSGVTIGYPVIASVEPGSPAQAAGLVAGDTILAYNDVAANTDPAGVKNFLKAGSELVIKIRRNGVRSLRLTVARRTAQNAYREAVTISTQQTASLPLMESIPGGPIAIAASVPSGRAAPFAGVYFARLNAGLAGALRVRDAGVLVVDAGNGSPAMRSGLQAGDVITRADSISVVSPLEIATALQLASGRHIVLDVLRMGKPRKLTIDW